MNFGCDETEWDGDESSITVDRIQLWQFIEQLDEHENELLEDCVLLITQHFDARVKSFVQNILLGPGQNKVPIKYYSYRVEFQQR